VRCRGTPFAPAVVMASTICRSLRARAGAARSSKRLDSYVSNRAARSSKRAMRSNHCEILPVVGTSDSDIVITLVFVAGCEPCRATCELVARFVADNRSRDISVHLVDAEADGEALVHTRALTHPTVILEVGGQERVRLTGELTHRRLLRNTLPVLYDDDRVALAQLRRQMNSPTETFPQGPLRGRVRQAQKLELLGRVSLFAGLNKRQLSRLARLAEELHAATADQLTAEGDAGDEFFVVVSGGVKVTKNGRKVATLGPGECFGEMSLLDDEPRSATVVATHDTTLLAIHRGDFDRHLMSSPTVMRALLSTLSRRIR
jgi:CRP/FNR family cyclic AMP-dependent transcriptional regulator